MALPRITSPHATGNQRTQRVMLQVLLATVPAVLVLTWLFGIGTLVNLLWASLGSSLQRLMHDRPRLLLARIQALLRRSEPAEPAVAQNQRRLQFGPLVVDNALREAWLA